ncbi:hypothetical protein AMQ83_00045, partial [Paenibacillus riograndensis]
WDYANSNRQTETESMSQDALAVLKKARTTFIVAHRLSTIRSADQILMVHDGEIVERGSHDELMALGGRYFRMYQLQLGAGAGGGTELPAPAAVQVSGAPLRPSVKQV